MTNVPSASSIFLPTRRTRPLSSSSMTSSDAEWNLRRVDGAVMWCCVRERDGLEGQLEVVLEGEADRGESRTSRARSSRTLGLSGMST